MKIWKHGVPTLRCVAYALKLSFVKTYYGIAERFVFALVFS